ncbi:MAG: GntR family transcriptional regulator, partial [Spirochaetaceae bacterium]|nr:GntR family transcriptional regulator [Spirochaetaceae bacterium]
EDRAEPFQLALVALRERLRDGEFPPGVRIPVAAIAEALGLSATPIREALSRLAGEGLVEERRGQGFFLRSLSGADIANLFRLSLSFLSIVHGAHRAQLRRRAAERPPIAPGQDPVRDVERLFGAWMADGGSRALLISYRTLAIQLGPVRRVEGRVFRDLGAEAAELLATDGSDADRNPVLRRFHTRRIGAADELAALLAPPEEPPKI